MIIDKKLVDFIFERLYVTDIKNIDSIRKSIHSTMPSQTAEFILKLMSRNTKWKPLFAGDYVKLEIPESINPYEYELDILMDLGLYQDGCIFGKINHSGSWKSDTHNPYDPMMNVDVMLHDKDKKVCTMTYDICSADLNKLNGDAIPINIKK